MHPVGKKFAVFDASPLQPDLEAVGACPRKVNAGDGVVGVLLSGLRHTDDRGKHATVMVGVQAGSLLPGGFPA